MTGPDKQTIIGIIGVSLIFAGLAIPEYPRVGAMLIIIGVLISTIIRRMDFLK